MIMNLNKSIGGYFELETNNFGTVFHDQAIAVNSGRNAFEYILLNENYSKVYIPYYSCDVLLQPLRNLNIDFEYYFLDEEFLPKKTNLKKHEALLYINYYGIFNFAIKGLVKLFENIIIDNVQAFFAMPITDVPTFYSPRKFFGVPDGGFAYIEKKIDLPLGVDNSQERLSHLTARIEEGAEAGYNLFKVNEAKFSSLPLMKMSKLTNSLLQNIDFHSVLKKRNANYKILHKALKEKNELSPIIEIENINGPMVYPFLRKGNNKMRIKLIESKIYTAKFWPNVMHGLKNKDLFEYYLYENLIPLPIDQRYSKLDMDWIINKLRS